MEKKTERWYVYLLLFLLAMTLATFSFVNYPLFILDLAEGRERNKFFFTLITSIDKIGGKWLVSSVIYLASIWLLTLMIRTLVQNKRKRANYIQDFAIQKVDQHTSKPIAKKVICSKEWIYELSVCENELRLWVYLGGIAEMVREIKLSQNESLMFEQQGEKYILELANEIQQLDSSFYSLAIKEGRAILNNRGN